LGEITDNLRVRQGMAIGTRGYVTECIQPEFKVGYHGILRLPGSHAAGQQPLIASFSGDDCCAMLRHDA
jgi:hypothetical protein